MDENKNNEKDDKKKIMKYQATPLEPWTPPTTKPIKKQLQF